MKGSEFHGWSDVSSAISAIDPFILGDGTYQLCSRYDSGGGDAAFDDVVGRAKRGVQPQSQSAEKDPRPPTDDSRFDETLVEAGLHM